MSGQQSPLDLLSEEQRRQALLEEAARAAKLTERRPLDTSVPPPDELPK